MCHPVGQSCEFIPFFFSLAKLVKQTTAHFEPEGDGSAPGWLWFLKIVYLKKLQTNYTVFFSSFFFLSTKACFRCCHLTTSYYIGLPSYEVKLYGDCSDFR